MQRDFLEPGGFGESLGNDVSLLQAAVPPIRAVLAAARAAPGSWSCIRGRATSRTSPMRRRPSWNGASPRARIGAPGPMGRILIRGEPGHGIVPALAPMRGEVVIDKPGKGAFYATDLGAVLAARRIATLLVCGVTTEVCVHTTIREGNDRGYRCVAIGDGCASYFPEFHRVGLAMIAAQGGIFGWVSSSAAVIAALSGTS